MSLHKSISTIRVEIQRRSLKKSGKNNHAGFAYFELSDFLPTLNELMLSEGVNDVVSFTDNATLTLVKDDEREVYSIPFTHFQTPTTKNGSPMMQDVQYLGAMITYYKRYLYMSAFGITDGEVIDAMDNSLVQQVKTYLTASKATERDKKQYKVEFMERALTYGLEKDMVKDYLSWLGIDVENANEVHNTIVKFLKSEDYLGEQVEMYIEYKRKHP
jgi:hypothetical protein